MFQFFPVPDDETCMCSREHLLNHVKLDMWVYHVAENFMLEKIKYLCSLNNIIYIITVYVKQYYDYFSVHCRNIRIKVEL